MKKSLVLIFALLITVLLCACTVDVQHADPKVVKIDVGGISKTEYVACDAIDIDGATLTVTYDNSDVETIDLTLDMLDPTSYDMDTPGTYSVKVNYEKSTTSFAITVVSWELVSVELASAPYVTEYVVGEEVDTEGATILCTFAGKKTKTYNVTPDMLQTYDNTTPGVKNVYLTYRGVVMTFSVAYFEKTPTGIKIVDDATDNFVYQGLGDRFDISGMTVRITYDNMQSPEYVAKDIERDLFVSIDDSEAGTVTAVLMYNPTDYAREFSYVYYGEPKVKVGDIVKPLDELASNKLIRDGQTIALDPILSKSYGTVKTIVDNGNSTSTMIIDTAVSYSLTGVEVKVGDVVDNGDYVGKIGSVAEYAKGGGVVEDVNNGVVTIRTAPTTSFTSNVKSKSFVSMEILDYPRPEKYYDITTINNMIQGDDIDRATGRVRIYFDDGSTEDFRMDEENHIRVVNAGADSVNNTTDISAAGRHELWIVYGGVLTNRTSMWVGVEGKYPTRLIIEETSNTISGRTFYFGDTISIASMRYYVVFNNETESEREQLTQDMLGEGCSFYCEEANSSYTSKIFFSLPDKYSALIPSDGSVTDTVISSEEFTYYVEPQPITGIAFVDKPSKVYVSSVSNISYDGAKLNVYYRNGAYQTLTKFDSIKYETVFSWNDIESYQPSSGDDGARAVVFTLEDDARVIDIDEILAGNGYQAKIIYFDAYGNRSTPASFTYFLMDAKYEVESIKVDLPTFDGIKGYKDEYSQYEDWDLSGITLKVTYKGTAQTVSIDAKPSMIFDSNTDTLGTQIPVKFTYLGVTDETTFKITVKERKPTAINVLLQGKTEYLDTYNGGIDFSNFRISLSYNAGMDEPISGLTNVYTEEKSSGWWYKMYNNRGEEIKALFNQTGMVTYVLYYSYPDAKAENGYSYVSTPAKEVVMESMNSDPESELYIYTVDVVENTYTITSISYDLDIKNEQGIVDHNLTYVVDGKKTIDELGMVKAEFPNESGLHVLTEVASGWELMLSEYVNGEVKTKVLTVNYVDAEGNISTGLVNVTKEMLDYNELDTSTGYRRVAITYKNQTCDVYVYVWRAELTEVSVFRTPLQNYIYSAINDESDLVLDGGVIRLSFNRYTRLGDPAGNMYKYVSMASEDVTYGGFINGLYSKNGEDIIISVLYKSYEDLKTSYVIRVFDKQDVEFTYTNTIFFYGNVASAGYEAYTTVDEFTLPRSIELRYLSTIDYITLEQYAKLDESSRKTYMPVTVHDDKERLAQVLFISRDKTYTEKYIDPAAGYYYAKYGNVAMIEERFFELLTEDQKSKFKSITTYDSKGNAIKNVYYSFDITIDYDNVVWYEEVIIDKLSVEEYNALGSSEQVGYEEFKNEYYLIMQVEDDRPIATRYYETTGYALQSFTIIQKVIDVSVVSSQDKAKLLRVSTLCNGNATNANPYAILYLLNSVNLIGITDGYKKDFMSDILITSPNADYFEILVTMNASYTGSAEQEAATAEVFYKILCALYEADFVKFSGITMSKVDINYGGTEVSFNYAAAQKDAMIAKIKEIWQSGVNVFTQEEVDSGEYYVTYSMPYGETLTRNGILQLLEGSLSIEAVYDDDNVLVGYTVRTGTLGHSSYTIDLTSTMVTVN